jgi:CRISPR/Cas system-associated exonuclease Cas4 (RecB family)
MNFIGAAKMMLSATYISNFLHCPYKAYYKESLNNKTATEQYHEDIKKCIFYFWWQRQAGFKVSFNELKERWVSIHKAKDSLAIDGASELWMFWQTHCDEESKIVAIDTPQAIEVGDHIVELSLDLIKSHDSEIEIECYKCGVRPTAEFKVASDIELTLASYAFKKLYGRNEDRVVSFYTRNGNSFILHKTEEDYTRLERIVSNIATCKENKLYVPRANCGGCEYKKLCLKKGVM